MSEDALKVNTRCAHWGYDEHLFFGYKVFAELAGHESITGLIALSVLGRRLSKVECAVLDDAATSVTLADPRIWPLKLTRLIASYGSAGAGVAAGLLILEDARVGPWTIVKAAEALVELHAEINGREDDTEFVAHVVCAHLERHHVVWGFGTPFRAHDERLTAFRTCMRNRKRDGLPFWRTMDAVSKGGRSRRKLEPNVSFACAAVFLDLGISVSQIGPLSLSLVFHMFLANGTEGAIGMSAVLRELPEDRIRYTGRPARNSPRLESASVNPGEG